MLYSCGVVPAGVAARVVVGGAVAGCGEGSALETMVGKIKYP